jgi:ATP-binding cassette, subfamily B, multidrug efflux pump
MSSLPADLLQKPFRFYWKKHQKMVILGLIALGVTNALETVIPFLVGKAIDKIVGHANFQSVLQTVGVILIFTVCLSATRYLWRVFWGAFHHRVAEDLRNRLFAKYTDLSPSFFRARKVGQLISLIAHDTNSFRMGIGPGMLILFDGIFYACFILPVMFSISPDWTWKTLVLMPFIPFTVRALLTRLHNAFHERQDRFADMSGSAQEIVSGIRVIKCFAQEQNQTGHFNEYSKKFQLTCNTVARWDAFFPPALELPVAVGSVLLLLIGAPDVVSGAVSLGSFFAFYQYIQKIVGPMEAIGAAIGQIQEGRASFTRIKEILEMRSDVADMGTIELPSFESLEVKGLSFTYPGKLQPALQNISFNISKGQTLGIVGETGAGKTTLIELICRQYPVAPGTILINGHSIEDVKMSSLRHLMGVVPQESFLFTNQVDANLALSKDEWAHEEVKSAAASVRLDQEIESWPQRYQEMVGERGVNLSGGQKQRMTLARALMKDAHLVILDDSLSAVDGKTEQSILKRLKNDLEKTTAIIVSHRLASVAFADKVLVLKNGKMEAIGSHLELLKVDGTYAKLYAIQKEAHAQ